MRFAAAGRESQVSSSESRKSGGEGAFAQDLRVSPFVTCDYLTGRRVAQEDAPMTSESVDPTDIAVIIVDHGSRRAESNAMLEAFVDRFRQGSAYRAVEPAHMEVAEPSIATAFDRCVAGGARCVVVIPYFLLPGKHWGQDIPRLTAAAAAAHRDVSYLVGAPIGLHPMMMDVIQARLDHCLAHAAGEAPQCEACEGTDRCRMRQG